MTVHNSMRKFCALAMLWGAFLPSAQASCWVISELIGTAYSQDDGYTPTEDAISYPITLTFDGRNSRTEPGDLQLMQMDEFLLVGIGKSDAFATVETYQVDPVLGIALYTKAMTARSIFSGLSGARTFVGKAQRCNP